MEVQHISHEIFLKKSLDHLMRLIVTQKYDNTCAVFELYARI